MMVLGAAAVGKTTLLATMYNKLVQTTGSISLIASNNTGVDLANAYDKLAKISNQPNFRPMGRLLEGTQGIIEHQFGILFENKKILDLSFYDTAGGIVLEKEESKDFKEFKRILTQQASVIVNVIDGSALMEGSDLYWDKSNRPNRIRELLLPALSDSLQPHHLVLFVITKCESWLKDEQSKQQLLKNFETRYEKIIKLVGNDQTVGVFLPVKTLGCIRFARIENKGQETEEAVFDKEFSPPPESKPLPFNPEYIEQPLLYGLIFVLLQLHRNNSSWWQKVFYRAKYRDWQNALEELSTKQEQAKKYGNFTLLEI